MLIFFKISFVRIDIDLCTYIPVIVISDSDINVDSIDVAPCSVEAVPIQNKKKIFSN